MAMLTNKQASTKEEYIQALFASIRVRRGNRSIRKRNNIHSSKKEGNVFSFTLQPKVINLLAIEDPDEFHRRTPHHEVDCTFLYTRNLEVIIPTEEKDKIIIYSIDPEDSYGSEEIEYDTDKYITALLGINGDIMLRIDFCNHQ